MTVRDYSTTPGSNNAAPPNGWPEGQAPSTVNDCARQMMAEVRESFEEQPYMDFGDDPTRVDNDTFTVAGDLTARYPVGARVKLVGATTGTGRITVSSHAAGTTTIDVVMDSGNVPLTLTRVAVYSFHLDLDANPSGTIGLSAVNGTASTFLRSDSAPALSQAIVPTWTASHTFSKAYSSGTPLSNAVVLSSSIPMMAWNDSDAAADNRLWEMFANSLQFQLRAITDDVITASNPAFIGVRSGATISSFTFPTDASGGIGGVFRVGTANTASGLNNVLGQIRTTAAQSALGVRTTTSGNSPLYVHNEATSGDNSLVTFLTDAASTRGSIDFDRAGTAVRYNTTSDRTLKMNIVDAQSAIQVLQQIRVRAFNWRETSARVNFGFVAQEINEILPAAVSPGDGNRSWAMDYSKLVPILTKALQETIARCASLEERISALKA